LICTLILVIGLLAIAGLLAVTTQMHVGAREAARSTRLAQDKIDELMKLDFDDDAKVAIGGSLTTNQADHFEQDPDGLDGVTIRWTVAAGPVTDTRILTVRIENLRARQYGREVELSTIIRNW
jgi:Tfp pilus assembly protein PilV